MYKLCNYKIHILHHYITCKYIYVISSYVCVYIHLQSINNNYKVFPVGRSWFQEPRGRNSGDDAVHHRSQWPSL